MGRRRINVSQYSEKPNVIGIITFFSLLVCRLKSCGPDGVFVGPGHVGKIHKIIDQKAARSTLHKIELAYWSIPQAKVHGGCNGE